MPPVAYSVVATLPDEHTREAYIAWLRSGHLAEVLGGGATLAQVIRVDDPAQPLMVESRYEFPSPGAFDVYLREHAPRLRAEGIARFGVMKGFSMRRQVGTILG